MSGFLLDTNVVSEMVKPRPSPAVLEWLNATEESLLHLSVLTVGELRKGITRLRPGRRRISLESWLDYDLPLRFSERVLPIDLAIADRWGRIVGSDAARRSPLPLIDSMLAATALHHGLTLVTRDTAHSAVTGVEVFDPWKL